MFSPAGPRPYDRSAVFLVIGVVIGLVGGIALAVALPQLSATAKSSPPSLPPVGQTPVPGCEEPAPASSGTPPSVVGHGGAVGAASTVTTSSFDAPAGSTVLVFAGYVNSEIGGGTVGSVDDSAGDAYALVDSTGDSANHTEDVYEATTSGSPDLSVSVTFANGDTSMGGSVAAVDVAGSDPVEVGAACATSGVGGEAYTPVTDNATGGSLWLLGVSGQGKDAPFAAATGETALDSGNATTGPWTDGVGYATFSATSDATTTNLTASLHAPAVWSAIGLALVGEAWPPSVAHATPSGPVVPDLLAAVLARAPPD
jgi:hypothetical protein